MNCHLNERSKTMQTCITKIFLLPALIAGLNLIPAGRVTAQTFTVLHSFRPTGPYTNSDGTAPEAVLVLSGDMLYGTASGGGSTGSGTVFAVNTNGTGFTVLHSFTALDEYTNIDGSRPNAGVIRSGNTLYGTAYYGGSSGNGTVFAVNTDGTGFTVLRSFTATSNSYPYGNSDGAAPSADLIVTNNILYGTTRFGGASGNGTLFRVNTDGTGFTNLYGFTATTTGTNSDGASPEAGLILSGNTLYGTASGGGRSGNGTVFAININGTGFTNLHSFTAVAAYPNNTNSDGTSPFARLVLAGNTLYGTASSGGGSGVGTVFAVNTDGTGFTNLHDLDSSSAS